MTNNRPEILQFLPEKSDRILDVGCGIGQFANYIKKEKNAEVWGIEYDKDKGEEAKNVIDKVFIGDASEEIHNVKDNYFDLICFNDVLEHLYDPYTVLEVTKKKLANNALVFASIPSIRYFRALLEIIVKKELQYTDFGTFDRTHVRFFTKKSMIRMFEDAGYEILKIKGINKSKSFRPTLLKIFTFGKLDDSQYLQYGILARVKNA